MQIRDARRAGRTARLTRRSGAVDFKAGSTAYELADVLGSADVDHALTADAGVNLYGRTAIDRVTVAARDQVVIDAYGGIDRMAEQADILLGRRVA